MTHAHNEQIETANRNQAAAAMLAENNLVRYGAEAWIAEQSGKPMDQQDLFEYAPAGYGITDPTVKAAQQKTILESIQDREGVRTVRDPENSLIISRILTGQNDFPVFLISRGPVNKDGKQEGLHTAMLSAQEPDEFRYLLTKDVFPGRVLHVDVIQLKSIPEAVPVSRIRRAAQAAKKLGAKAISPPDPDRPKPSNIRT
ncbi:MAG: hypothetical protein JWO41_878 [Candidatus Saccharibacteria bacterium]|nr:hypothetical protein [Candidatus Saccharibacteria bacterium]